jgi:Phytanoyl-CoA dioxygenase (PhyH)
MSVQSVVSDRAAADFGAVENVLACLEQDGVVCLPNVFSPDQLAGMQRAFNARLKLLRWSHVDGYEKTELYRHMVEDVLTLDQGFVDIALHPLIKEVLKRYLGRFSLVEARGWRSLPTARDFHGWHGDEWYEQAGAETIPREVKVGFFLTDVRSGAFNYIKGTHRRQHPRRIRTADLPAVPKSEIRVVDGPAGTAFLFDTSGIHRQAVPLLEPRHVVFLNYHDPAVRLQKEDIDGYRYHPLLLNAAFLGHLGEDDQQILGFGDKTNYTPAFVRPTRYPRLHRVLTWAHSVSLRLTDLRVRIGGRLATRPRRSPG